MKWFLLSFWTFWSCACLRHAEQFQQLSTFPELWNYTVAADELALFDDVRPLFTSMFFIRLMCVTCHVPYKLWRWSCTQTKQFENLDPTVAAESGDITGISTHTCRRRKNDMSRRIVQYLHLVHCAFYHQSSCMSFPLPCPMVHRSPPGDIHYSKVTSCKMMSSRYLR